MVVLYPAFKNTSSLDKLIHTDPAAAALFGVTGSISSSGGWLDGNLYANFFPLILLLLTVGYGAASLAGIRGVRLVATDLRFTAGAGPQVRGPAEALLVAIAGRRGVVSELTGPGQAKLARRIGG